ncbi:hypothetical protein [Streptomyces sp. NPDC056491]|uniref:hypothetical protein n=1 Tax=Streptomyces sp. NPDC056491 TaxID=3345837 RepID=UPI0036BA9ECB
MSRPSSGGSRTAQSGGAAAVLHPGSAGGGPAGQAGHARILARVNPVLGPAFDGQGKNAYDTVGDRPTG